MKRRKRFVLRTSAPAFMIIPRLLLALDLSIDAARALGLNHYLGVSRIERHLSPLFGGYIKAPTLHALAWLEVACAALLAVGLLTRAAALPSMLAIAAALESWSVVGTLGTAGAIDETIHATAIVVIGLILLIGGAGPISIDARVSGGR